MEIDPSTGLLATERCLQREMEYFIKGTEPTIYCYGNNYERSMGSSAPTSIYASPSSEADWEAYDQMYEDNPANIYASPSDEPGWDMESLDDTDNPPDIYTPPSKEMIWEADNELEPQE